MIKVRHANDRPHTKVSWLDGRHSFSFGRHHDPHWNGHGPLVVINDDTIAPNGGFPEHPHDNMEIISYVVDGKLAHKDSTGNQRIVAAGGVQRMTAGTGVTHSEFNPSDTNSTRLLQVWIAPKERNTIPSYEDTEFSIDQRRNTLQPIASPDGREGSTTIGQNAVVYASILETGTTLTHTLTGPNAWIQVVKGTATVNDIALIQGDGAAISDETILTITGNAELLLFDLPN